MANGNCHRRVAGVLRLAAKCGEVTPIRRELLYTIIIEIRHKDIAFGANRDGRRGGEPALERPVKAQGKRPSPLVQEIATTGELPVPLFCAGGLATPADASLVMQLGAQAVFVGSGIFKSDDPAPRARAIVEAPTNFAAPAMLAKVSRGLGDAMPGLELGSLETRLADRGW